MITSPLSPRHLVTPSLGCFIFRAYLSCTGGYSIGARQGRRAKELSMAEQQTEDWDIWYPKAGATGIPFARGRVTATETLLVHAAPPVLTVAVRGSDGCVLAEGKDLAAADVTPITRLTRRDNQITR